MKPVVFAFPGDEHHARAIVGAIGGEAGSLALHRYPDGETNVRLDTPVDGVEVVLVCGFHRPDAKLLPLCFAADAARDLGAVRVGLVAPYLAYLRQDRRFRPGEAITSVSFARILSAHVDWLVTVDPHLHRYASLSAVYSIPARVVHAAPSIAEWIDANVERPVVVGPDSESEQWVAEVASRAQAPFVVLEKTRRGDSDVEVSIPQIERWRDHTPVLVDDIVSTARTMIAATRNLRRLHMRGPICIGVHAVFAGSAYEELRAAGAAQVVTCNTIEHPSNRIDVTPAIGRAVRELMSGDPSAGVR